MKPLTAAEAMKLSKTGFIWTRTGLPVFIFNEHLYFVRTGERLGSFEVDYDWFPDPPHLRVDMRVEGLSAEGKQSLAELHHAMHQTEKLQKLLKERGDKIAELEKQLKEAKASLVDGWGKPVVRTPITLKSCESEPPNSVREVIIFIKTSRDAIGIGWYNRLDDWTFRFIHPLNAKIKNYYWCEIPEVKLPEN